ncbi:MAG: serine/threonine protein kinase [Pirellulales bacterium]|nr:serine/threonine protein kinase [Pirellulales bacterium]
MSEPREDEPHFEALDTYVRRLHAGELPDREALLRAHPELSSALDCLEVLERFAPEVAEGEDEPEADSSPSWPVRPEAGGDFGPYELLCEIGRGGMGVVYKARQKALDRTVAIKMILAGYVGSDEHLARFRAEAKAAAKLRHPHIVHIHEVGQIHGQHFYAMEFVDGVSLARRIEEGPMEIDAAVRLIVTVARAVDDLHQEGIIHRDLKPSNILLDSQDRPYVSDFGLAKVFAGDSAATATGVIAGTPSYMSPEQARGRTADVGPAADIYGLGAILYELLTGRAPFREDNPLETVMQVLSREPMLPRVLNPKVPRNLQVICLKCLSKSPEDRYASAGALADDLERFLRGEPLEARPPDFKARLLRWTRRQPALASRLAVLVVLYTVNWINFRLGLTGEISWKFQAEISVIVAVWIAASVVFQQFLNSRRWTLSARFGWGTLDAIMMLMVLLVADGAASPLVVGYPLLIVASGLWFRVRFVSYMTCLSLISYGILVLDFYYWRPELAEGFDHALDRHIIFCVALVAEAGAVAYLVQRVRTLNSYCGSPDESRG